MIRTQIYLPESLYKEVGLLAKREKKPKAQIIREVVKSALEKRKENVGEALDKIIKAGKKLRFRGPKDLSVNHDKYLYERP
jgi:metal-responsive CopG/Arc/MetJ family transcriptional regulator